MAQPSRYSPEVRRRAVWMAFWCDRPVGPVEQRPNGRLFYTPTGVVNLGPLESAARSPDGLGVRFCERLSRDARDSLDSLGVRFANSNKFSSAGVEAGGTLRPIPLLPPTGVVTWAALRGG